MQLWTLAALLVLQCSIPLTVADDSQIIGISSLASAGTIEFKGSTLKVYEIDGVQVAEPRVSFGSSCDSLRYNNLYLKYQLTLPINIDVNTLTSPTDKSKNVGQVTLTDLLVKADKALASNDAKVSVMASVTKADKGEAQLIFLCDTFIRCEQLKDEVSSNPEQFRRSVQLIPVGKIYSVTVKFDAVRTVNLPQFTCSPGQWVVFQRRVDGSLSFAKNWDAYVKGFGHPESNYWMGLENLFVLTVTGAKNGFPETSRCQLRVETEDFYGNKYWGEYKQFEVLGPETNYRLRVGMEVAGSQDIGFVSQHNEMQFSTYDRDHDIHAASCSQMFGYGGWWFGNCHRMNLNGAYNTDKSVTNNPEYTTIYTHEKHIPMKYTLMKFRCN